MKVPALPALSSKVDPEVRKSLDILKAFFAKAGALTTINDLVNTGVAEPDGNGGTGRKLPVTDDTVPPILHNFTATGAFNAIILEWDDPEWANLSYIEVRRAEVDDFGVAKKVGSTVANVYPDTPPDNSTAKTYYYWARIVSQAGIAGPWAGSVSASTANDPAYLLDLLTGQLTESQLYQTLTNKISEIPGLLTRVSAAESQIQANVDQLNDLVIAEFDSATAYTLDQKVKYLGNIYNCILATTAPSPLPTDTTYWTLVGAYTGDTAQQVATNAANAADSASAAANSANLALVYRDDAGDYATAAHTDMLAAQSARDDAQGSASAAATSASTAATKATDASSSAASASLAANTATTKAGEATVSAGQAASSATSAEGSATTAGNYASAAASSKTSAENAASAASTSANTAATKATEAGNSALSASTASNNAASSASSASTYAINAASSATTAQGYAESTAIDYSAVTARLDNAGGSGVTVEQSLSATANEITGLQGQYTVKVDSNGYVSGFGLATTVKNAAPFSEFIIKADKFSIAPVAASPTSAEGSPFFYITAPTTINGVLIPAGAYMKAAFIADATINTAKIKDLAVDDSKIANLAVTEAKIANLAVTTAKMDNLAVTTGKIADLAVNNAKIGNAAVTSLKIGNNAVTIPVISKNVSNVSVADGATVVAHTSTLVMPAGLNGNEKVALTCSARVLTGNGGGYDVTMEIFKGSVSCGKVGTSQQNNMTGVGLCCVGMDDNPVSGTNTYTVKISAVNSSVIVTDLALLKIGAIR